MKTIELPYSEVTNIPKIVCHDKGNKSKSKITFINSDKNWYFKILVSEKNKKSNKNRAAIIGSPFFFGNFQSLNKNMLPWAKLQNISDRQSFLRFFL